MAIRKRKRSRPEFGGRGDVCGPRKRDWVPAFGPMVFTARMIMDASGSATKPVPVVVNSHYDPPEEQPSETPALPKV